MNRARLRTVVFLLFVMPALAAAAAQFREADGQLEVQTPALRLVVRHGSIVECDNALTGQRLCSPDAGPSPAEESRSGLLFEDGEAVSADERAKTAVAISPTEAATTTTLTGGHVLVTRVREAPDGALAITQEGRSTRPGLESISLGFPCLETSGTAVLIPTGTGLRLDAGFRGTRAFDWPADWRVQFALIQGRPASNGAAGGLAIRAEDPQFALFKAIRFQNAGSRLGLSLITYATQPVTQTKAVRSAEWRIAAYQGPWTTPAEAARARLLAAGGAKPSGAAPQPWFRSVDLIVTPTRMRTTVEGPLNILKHRSFLLALSKRVNPSRTLLNLAYDWREHEMDTWLPFQQIDLPNAADLVNYARSLGFRVMLSMDIRCDLRHPFYPQVRAAHMRWGRPQAPPLGQSPSPVGAEYVSFIQLPLWKARLNVPETQLAAINPAASAWRKTVLGMSKNAITRLMPEAVHVAGATYVNDANGLIEGANSIQGLRAFLRELRQMAPVGTALSIDAWDEMTFGAADLAQLRLPGVYEIDRSKPDTMRFDADLAKRAHPITAWLLRRDFPPYAAFGQPSPDFAKAWADYAIATAALAPLAHASELDRATLERHPPALESLFAQVKAAEALEAVLDPNTWSAGAPRSEWVGPKGRVRLAVGADGAVEATQAAAGANTEEVIFRASEDGLFE